MSKAKANTAKASKTASKASKKAKAPKVIAKKETPQKQENTASERSYGRSKEKVAEILATAKTEKAFPNPFRENSSYANCCNAIVSLGLNKWHDVDAVIKAYKAVADKAALKAFRAVEPRNENGKNVDERIAQNCTVICRAKEDGTGDYGLPLVNVGYIAKRQRTEEKIVQFGIFKISK